MPRLIRQYLGGLDDINQAEADAWLADLKALDADGGYSFAVLQFCILFYRDSAGHRLELELRADSAREFTARSGFLYCWGSRLLRELLAGWLVVAGALVVAPAARAGTFTNASFPDHPYSVAVPFGISAFTVSLYGASGGSVPSGEAGGKGGLTVATLSVSGGEVYTLVLGGHGVTCTSERRPAAPRGPNGGGASKTQRLGETFVSGGSGGGATDLRDIQSGGAYVLVAGGGGRRRARGVRRERWRVDGR